MMANKEHTGINLLYNLFIVQILFVDLTRHRIAYNGMQIIWGVVNE